MLARRLIARTLIVPPAGLVGNRAQEMHTLFNLPFRIITGNDARLTNPFCGPGSDLLIVSIDTLAGKRMFARLQEETVQPYDFVVFDEAHKLAAQRGADFRVRRTDRYRLAEALAGVTSEGKRSAQNTGNQPCVLSQRSRSLKDTLSPRSACDAMNRLPVLSRVMLCWKSWLHLTKNRYDISMSYNQMVLGGLP